MHLQLILFCAATEESQRVNDSGVLLTHSEILILFSFSFLHAQKRKKKRRPAMIYSPLPGVTPIGYCTKW